MVNLRKKSQIVSKRTDEDNKSLEKENNMSQVILTFQLQKEKEDGVAPICKVLGIRLTAVPMKDYAQKLGYLAGVKGFPREKAIYGGIPFPAEMLVFSGMDSSQVDAFLAEYKKTGLPAIGLKAVITPHNVFWTADELFRELMKEHLSFH